jgi:hypothetical protein
VSGQLHTPAALPPGKETLITVEYKVGWTAGPVWITWRSKNSCPYRDSNCNPLVVQPVASRYTDCANPALKNRGIILKLILETFVKSVDCIELNKDKNQMLSGINCGNSIQIYCLSRSDDLTALVLKSSVSRYTVLYPRRCNSSNIVCFHNSNRILTQRSNHYAWYFQVEEFPHWETDISPLSMKCSNFYRTRRFITIFTRVLSPMYSILSRKTSVIIGSISLNIQLTSISSYTPKSPRQSFVLEFPIKYLYVSHLPHERYLFLRF